MAQLFRVSKLYDSSESQTFTFILPAAAAVEYPPEILSRDFVYAGHKWRISLLKQDRHLSPNLQMTSVSEGVRCWIDFSFVLVHRQSFTDSEQYMERQREFNWRRSTHGCRTFVTLDDLSKRQFTDARGEFLFEVVLKNPKTVFEQIFTLSVMPKTSTADSRHNDARDYQRYDSTVINFGEQEWLCVFCPNMDRMENGSMRHMVQMNRRSRSDTLCRVRYRIILGRNPTAEAGSLRSEIREEIFDFIGTGEAFYFTHDYFQYAHEGNRLQLTLELYSISCVNHMKLNVLSTDKRPVAQCFDRDRQTWCITTTPSSTSGERRRSRTSLSADLDSREDDCLSFTLLYPDVQNIPRNYLRFVSWAFHIIPLAKKRDSPNGTISAITAYSAPFEHYYSQLETDNGFVMKTKLTMNEIRENASKWLDDVDQRLTVQLEWLGSYLLLHPAYHAYDDVYRKHILQMRREVQALQAENNTLEKQVHDFQIMLANKASSGSDTPTRPRTASASSNVSGAGGGTLQPPLNTNRSIPSQLALTQGGLNVGDTRRPARSISGIDVSSSASDPARPSTPRQRTGSGAESAYRNGVNQKVPRTLGECMRESEHEFASEYDDGQEITIYSPPSTPSRSQSSHRSPSKRPSPRSISDAPLTPDQSVHRGGSVRASRRESPQRYDPYDDDQDEFGERSTFVDRSSYADHYVGLGGGALVRSKSASPYPQRHHPVYWRAETPPNTRPEEESRESGQKRPVTSTLGASQLKPEATRFGDDRSFNRHQNRSFRLTPQKERKMTSPRRAQHGKEAEDVGDGSYYRAKLDALLTCQ